MDISQNLRRAAAILAVSGAGFAAYLGFEGYSETAVAPVKGDVPTYGFGTTRGPDLAPLKGGEQIAPEAAVRLAFRDLKRHEDNLKQCLGGADLFQHEYDAFLSLDTNTGGVCASSIPDKLKAGDYAAACKTILDFDGFCTKPKITNAAGKKVCPPGARIVLPGLVRRRNAEYRLCAEGVYPDGL
ncbi:MAG: lysozyme [Candidatus Accumulibacter sp.]|nr:lysozyme [Accumulibacter sp.]